MASCWACLRMALGVALGAGDDLAAGIDDCLGLLELVGQLVADFVEQV